MKGLSVKKLFCLIGQRLRSPTNNNVEELLRCYNNKKNPSELIFSG